MATPIEAETSRLGSFVEDSARTPTPPWPGFSSDSPSSRSISSQWGGKIELTRTRLKLARWASRRDISKLVSFSLCRPTPLVRKALVGTNMRESINPSPPLSFVPHRWPGGDRRLGIPRAIGGRLYDPLQHLRRRERGLRHLGLRLAALLATHDQHVARRVNPQPAAGLRWPPGDDRRAPFPPLALERAEQIDRVDLGRRHAGRHRLRQLRPARALPGRQRTREAGVWACCHRST